MVVYEGVRGLSMWEVVVYPWCCAGALVYGIRRAGVSCRLECGSVKGAQTCGVGGGGVFLVICGGGVWSS